MLRRATDELIIFTKEASALTAQCDYVTNDAQYELEYYGAIRERMVTFAVSLNVPEIDLAVRVEEIILKATRPESIVRYDAYRVYDKQTGQTYRNAGEVVFKEPQDAVDFYYQAALLSGMKAQIGDLTREKRYAKPSMEAGEDPGPAVDEDGLGISAGALKTQGVRAASTVVHTKSISGV